jgi:hypothetical protein
MAAISTEFSINGSNNQGGGSPVLYKRPGFFTRIFAVFANWSERQTLSTRASVSTSVFSNRTPESVSKETVKDRLADIDRPITPAVALAKVQDITEELASLEKGLSIATQEWVVSRQELQKANVHGLSDPDCEKNFCDAAYRYKKLSSQVVLKRLACKKAQREHDAFKKS